MGLKKVEKDLECLWKNVKWNEERWNKYLATLKFQAARLCKITNIPFDDLYQNGFVGFLEALGRLDQTLSTTQQSRYIEQFIWHYLIKIIRELHHPVYIPLYLNSQINSQEISITTVQEEYIEVESFSQDKKTSSKSPHPNACEEINESCHHRHYRNILEKSINSLLSQGVIDQIEVVSFLLFHGLFNYPLFPLEDISRLLGISSNTVSKKVLKVMRLLKDAVPAQFSKACIFGDGNE